MQSDPLNPFDPAPAPDSAQPWLSPSRLPEAAPQAPARAAFELRPLSIGEVLDRTFTVYRSRFWLFCGIAAASAAMQTILAGGQLALQAKILRGVAPTAFSGPAILVGVGVGSVVALIAWLAYSVTQAATVYAVSETYLGRSTSIAESFRLTIGRWYAYMGIAIWQAASMMWIPMLLILPGAALLGFFSGRNAGLVGVGAFLLFLGCAGGFVGGFILYLRNMLAIPAFVVERLKVRAAMRRSKVLAGGAKGRIFVVLLISTCLYMVVGVLQTPLSMLMVFARVRGGGEPIAAEAGLLLISFIGHAVVAPVAMIGLTLLYFDQRVRKEAFDIAILLGDESQMSVPRPSEEDAYPTAVIAVPVSPYAVPITLPVRSIADSPIEPDPPAAGPVDDGTSL